MEEEEMEAKGDEVEIEEENEGRWRKGGGTK